MHSQNRHDRDIITLHLLLGRPRLHVISTDSPLSLVVGSERTVWNVFDWYVYAEHTCGRFLIIAVATDRVVAVDITFQLIREVGYDAISKIIPDDAGRKKITGKVKRGVV